MDIIKLDLPIQGMTCANCAARIEKNLKALPGIIDSSVNLANDSAHIEFEKEALNFEKIRDSIENLGYKVFGKEGKTEQDQFEIEEEKELQKQKNRFYTSLSLSIPVMIFSMNWIPLPDIYYVTLIKFLFIFSATTFIMIFSGMQFFSGFIHSIRNRYADMNTLIAIGTGTAFLYSTYLLFSSIFLGQHLQHLHLYYDTSATIITFILLGKLLEKKSRNKSSEAIKGLLNLQPKEVIVRRNGFELKIPVEYVFTEDILLIRPGDKIPVDGKIIKGFSTIDESLITGESLPVEKAPDDKVIGGTINKFGSFEFIAEKVGKDTYLSGIIELVMNSQRSKLNIQKYADKVASIFVPAVISIAALTFIIWYILSPTYNLSLALMNCVSVLIISCPCALGLATPTAIITGIGKAAEKGIFFKNSSTLETVKEINTIIFDKTGTITSGDIQIAKIIPFEHTGEQLLKIAGSLERLSEHPIGAAIHKHFSENNLKYYEVDNFESISGFGVKGQILNNEYLLGNYDLITGNECSLQMQDVYHEYTNSGYIVVFIAENMKVIGIILLEDSIKQDAKNLVDKLRKTGFEIILLTGDNRISAEKIGHQIHFDKIISDVKPEEKVKVIKDLQNHGKYIAMVGDGINDAPALSQANIGIALGSGADIAINSADIMITAKGLDHVFSAIQISQKTMQIIKQNLFWAFFYNIICIPVAAGILFPFNGFLLNPAVASIAMAFSSVSVVTNSLRLKRIITG